MDIRIRRTITLTFFLIFIVVSPMLLLYSSGFRYDFKSGALLRTGNIYIEAKDLREATVFLDGQPYKEPLTKKLFIKNLLPGEYTVKVEKDGWYAWEKKLLVEPTLTTFVKDLVLFEKNTPSLEIGKQIGSYEISPDKKLMAYVTAVQGNQEVYISNLEFPQEELVYRKSADAPLQLSWASSSNKLMISSADKVAIIKTASFPSSIANQFSKQSAQSVRWDENSDNVVYLMSSRNISKYDLVSGTQAVIYEAKSGESVQDFLNNGGQTVALVNDKDSTAVHIIKDSNDVIVANLSLSDNYKLDEWISNYLTVIDRSLNRISLIQLRDDIGAQGILKENIIFLDGNEAVFSNDHQKLLIVNDFELNELDLSSRRVNLISRFGQNIKGAMWYSDDMHVIINLDDKILISDLSINTEKGLLEIAQGQDLSQARLLNEKYLFFSCAIGTEKGLFKLRLR